MTARHGTSHMYVRLGCRCETCVTEYTAKMRRWRQASKARKRAAERGVELPRTSAKPVDPAECLTCVDVEWLMQWGETPEQVASRLGFARYSSMCQHLKRHGRHDLVARITSWSENEGAQIGRSLKEGLT